MYMSSRFQEGLEHHEVRIMVFKAQLMSSLFSQPFSTDLCPLYIIIINIISLFINYTYILYTCHCILHHNTSIFIQTIQGAPVAAKTLHYCIIILHCANKSLKHHCQLLGLSYIIQTVQVLLLQTK